MIAATLLFFTASYPYGPGETWKTEELDELRRGFGRIRIFPFSFAGNRNPKPLPDRVSAADPVLEDTSGLRAHALKVLTGGRLLFYLGEFLSRRLYRDRRWIVSWLAASIQIELLLRSKQYQAILREDRGAILYFFWSREWAYVIPFLRKAGFDRIMVRFHGFDLYEERDSNGGYIPYRRPLLQSLRQAIILSDKARDYLTGKYGTGFDTVVIPLGTRVHGTARQSDDDVLRIVTCASAAPVKRLSLLAKALALADRPVEWTHIGGGPLLDALQTEAARAPPCVSAHFTGPLAPHSVQPFYSGRPIDLFVNVSESEGLPVSILEAFASGIPAMATDVGGTATIVTSDTGILLPSDIGPEHLWAQIADFAALPAGRRRAMAEAARALIRKSYHAPDNARRLLAQFESIVTEAPDPSGSDRQFRVGHIEAGGD